MNLFDKAREALGQAAAAVSKEAEQLSVQAQLGNLQSELDRQLLEVGKRARELRAQNRFQDEQTDILLRRIVDLEEQMMELRRQALTGEGQSPTAATTAAPPAPTPPSGDSTA